MASVQFHPIDGYLLDGRPGKAEAIAAALGTRSDAPRAAPFYRALEALGVRAADEALIALRLVLAGGAPDDDAIRRLRGLAALARARDANAVQAALTKDRSALRDMSLVPADATAVAAAARAAYSSALIRASDDSS
ncbi:MAG: hypothetical protein ABR591_11650 [Candidatus Velthaea sp.]